MEEQGSFLDWWETLSEEEKAEEDRKREEAFAILIEEENQVSEHNQRIFKAIEKTLGVEYLKDVKDCLMETEAGGKLSIVDAPNEDFKDHYQEENWGSFNHVYVDQYLNGGLEGDSFAGYVYIPLKKGKYLKTHYNM